MSYAVWLSNVHIYNTVDEAIRRMFPRCYMTSEELEEQLESGDIHRFFAACIQKVDEDFDPTVFEKLCRNRDWFSKDPVNERGRHWVLSKEEQRGKK